MISEIPARLAANIFSLIPDRKHLASEGNFSGHGQFFADFALGVGGQQGGEHGDAGRRAVLGRRAFGDMDMNIRMLKKFRVDIPISGMRTDIGHGNAGRFLHHIAQVAGDVDASFALA
jgi:hypothetical protein